MSDHLIAIFIFAIGKEDIRSDTVVPTTDDAKSIVFGELVDYDLMQHLIHEIGVVAFQGLYESFGIFLKLQQASHTL